MIARTRVLAIAVVITIAFACSKASKPPAPASSLKLFDTKGALVVEMSPEGVLLDPAGNSVGTYDVAKHRVRVQTFEIDLASAVRAIGDHEIEVTLAGLGTHRVTIDDAGAITIDGAPFGRLSTVAKERERAYALLAAVPLLPGPKPSPPDASAVPDVEPPPPPPPPRPGVR